MGINLLKYKLFVVVWLLLTFVGQAIAATTVPCHDMNTMDMSQSMMMNHVMADDSMAHDMERNNENTAMLDCCQQECNCPVGLSVSAPLATLFVFNSLAISSQKIEQYSNLLLSQPLTSLYRPPIS